MSRRAIGLALGIVLSLALVATHAVAAPAVTLRAKLQPPRLGTDTAVSLGFRIAASDPGSSPLSNFAVRMPPGMSLAASELGLATCSVSTLLTRGGTACPHESLIGFGAARVHVPFGSQIVRERARLSIFMGRPVRGHTTTLFFFDGRKPVIAPLVLQGEISAPQGSPASILTTPIPPIPTGPEGPEGTLLALRATIGPRSLRYSKRVDGRVVSYRPKGIAIPGRCPFGGFVFAARFRFRDGTQAKARDTVPCPADLSSSRHDGRSR